MLDRSDTAEMNHVYKILHHARVIIKIHDKKIRQSNKCYIELKIEARSANDKGRR